MSSSVNNRYVQTWLYSQMYERDSRNREHYMPTIHGGVWFNLFFALITCLYLKEFASETCKIVQCT